MFRHIWQKPLLPSLFARVARKRSRIACQSREYLRPKLTVEHLESRRLLTAGDFDTTFGNSGIVQTDLANLDPSDSVSHVALQSDGKYILSGASNGRWALVRFNTDGSLDTTFDSDGRVLTDFSVAGGAANDLAVLPDGKILVAGAVGGFGSYDFALARYNPDGSLDTSFDGDGRVTSDFGQSESAYTMELDSSGRIVLAGPTTTGTSSGTVIARYNPDGSLDTTFSGDGVATISTVSSSQGLGLALQSDNKVVVAGSTQAGTDYDFAVVRFNTDGTLDSNFDSDGITTVHFGTGTYLARDAAVQADGAILVCGSYSGTTIAIARLTANGALDTSFDTDGRVTTAFQGSESAASMALQSDGKIIISGWTTINFQVDMIIARYNTNGSRDTSFDGDGIRLTDTGADDYGSSIAIEVDGRFVVAGSRYIRSADGKTYSDFSLFRFESNAVPDVSFDVDGRVTTTFSRLPSDDHGRSVVVQPDGEIIVGGWSFAGAQNYDFGLARYNTDGSLDNTFGGDGTVAPDFAFRTDLLYALALQSDGKIIAAGVSEPVSGTNYQVTVARYNIDGSLDISFDTDGVAIIAAPLGASVRDVAVQPDGKIVVVGGYTSSGSQLLVVRLNSDGSLDTSFDGDGKVNATLAPFSGFNWMLYSVGIQADGKIVAAGNGNNGLTVVRLNSNGTFDTTFDVDGKLSFTNLFMYGDGLALSPDGKIAVAGGSTVNGNDADFSIVQFNADGSLDTTFSGDGLATAHLGSNGDRGAGLVQQQNGKLVVAGWTYINGNAVYALARFHSDGSLDTTFSGDGIATVTGAPAFSTTVEGVAIPGLALQPDGGILLTTFVLNPTNNNDFLVARIIGDTIPSNLGDYNTNTMVDSSDYVLWRKTLYNATPAYSDADGDGDSTIDPDDYLIWRTHYAIGAPADGAESIPRGMDAATESSTFADGESTTRNSAIAAALEVFDNAATDVVTQHSMRIYTTTDDLAPHGDVLLAWFESRARIQGHGISTSASHENATGDFFADLAWEWLNEPLAVSLANEFCRLYV